MIQCLGINKKILILCSFIFTLNLIFSQVTYAVPPLAPNPINVTTGPNGTATITWQNVPPSSLPGSTISYRVYRGLITENPLSTVIINSTTALNFTDTVNAFDNGEPNDTAKDGLSWDAANNRWGQTYKYTVLAVDSADGRTNWENTTVSTIEIRVHWCDARSPNVNSLVQGPPDGSKRPPGNYEVRINFDYIDWTLGTPAAAVIQLNYSIDGNPQAPINMVLQGTQNPNGLTTLRATLPLSTAADGATIRYWVTGQDANGNILQSTATPKTILSGDEITFTIDATAPTITGINYMETGANPGIDQNDQIIVSFSEQIQTGQPGQNPLNISCFQLGRIVGGNFTVDPLGSFGVGATVVPGPLNNQVTIILGANPIIRFVAPPGVDLINSIRYSPTAGNAIRDLAGNSANSTVGYEIKNRLVDPASIELPNAPRPFINSNPVFTDVNNSGTVDANDTLRLVFSKTIILTNGTVANTDFVLPVNGDTLNGTGAMVAGTNNQIDFTIQAGSSFRVAGVFANGVIAPGSPSGIDVSAVNPNIVDEFGNRAQQVPTASGGPHRDIAGASTQGPRLITGPTAAQYTDIADANGIRDGLSANDTLILTFDKPIMLGSSPFTAANAFNLPVVNDNLDNPTFAINPANNRQLILTFQAPPNLTVYGTYSGNNNPGQPSAIDISNLLPNDSIIDIYGNKAQPFGTARDITSTDNTGPAISQIGTPVVYIDNAPLGVSQGDFIEIEFDKPIVLSGINSSAFQLSNLNLGTGATFTAVAASVNNKKLRITLGTNPVVTFTGANRSKIDVVNGTTQIQNWAGVGAVATSLRDIVPQSTVGPKLVSAVYTDNDNNGISANDTIVLTFDKPIIFTAANVTKNDFDLLPAGSSLGDSITVNNTGLLNTQLRIILGNNPNLVIAGTFGTDPNATGIDVKSPNTPNITDQMGNPAEASTKVDILGSDTTRPTLVSAVYTDTGTPLDGISAGDELTLTFSKAIIYPTTLSNNAFHLPVLNDSLATFTVVPKDTINPPLGPNQIRIRFTSTPTLKIAGVYNGNTTPGSSSGIDISSTIPNGMITDIYGNTAINSTVRDIGSTDTANPVPVAARYTDVGNDGVNQGDIIELDFSEPILVNPLGTTPIAKSHFTVTNGDLGGAGLTFEPLNNAANNITIKITLGAGASLQFNPPAAVNSTININDSGGAISSITDVSGNGAVRATTNININPQASEGPKIVSARYRDLTGNGVSEGDEIILTFNKNIIVTNPTVANFDIFGNNGTDNLGTNPQFNQTGVNSNQLKIILGTNPKLTIVGVYSGPAGTASAINIKPPSAVTIRDNLNQPAVPAADPIDIEGYVEPGPQIVDAIWEDKDGSGTVNANDVLIVKFNKAIVIPLPPPPPPTALTRTVFNFPVAGDYFDFTTYAHSANNEITFTLTGTTRFQVLGTYNGNNNPGQPSGINIASGGIPANSITDVMGNVAIPVAMAVDIKSADSTGPTLVTAVYSDFNNSNVVDAGDRLLLTFSEPILINSPVKTNFNVSNGDLGNNPTFTNGPLNTQLYIILGTGANLTFFGATTSSIDIAGTITTITDVSGNGATQSTQKFITVQAGGQGPLLQSCVWIDNVPLGVVSAGDVLRLTFDKNVILRNPPSVQDFVLPVTDDSLGVSITVVAGANPREINITLGTGAYLTIKGTYNPGTITKNSPSGIDISVIGAASGNITDIFGYNARQNTPVGVDITSTDTEGPRIISVIYEDVDTNGVTINDRLYVTFNENVTSPVWLNNQVPNVTAGNFQLLPTGTANLGTNPIFEWYDTMPNTIVVKLGNNPLIRVPGVFPTDPNATGMDVSGVLTSITDISGNGARPNTPAGVDISPFETTGPRVIAARYNDANNSKAVDQGDFIFIVFDKPIIINSPTAGDFNLPVANDTLGGLPSFQAGTNNRELKIVLGASPIINPIGLYSPTVLVSGSPSGIDVKQPSISSITDIYGNPALASAVAVDIDDGVGPSIVSAVYTDVDNMGMGKGDTLVLTFNEPIRISNVVATDFELPVMGDTLGTNPEFAVGPNPNQLTITLGTNPVLMVPGTFSQINTSAGSPSGINISTVLQPGHITDLSGNNAIRNALAVDITGPTGVTPPTLQQARWNDVNSNGVDQGDKLDLIFDKPIILRNFTPNDYNLPVTNDTLGTFATAAVSPTNNRTLVITLGASPKLTVPGVFNPTNTAPGSPSGIDISPNMAASGGLCDIYGNPAIPSSVKDIVGADTTGPILISALYYDVDNNGVSQNDILGLTFDKSIQISGTNFAIQFTLPIPGDSLGVNPIFEAGTDANQLRIKLGVNPFLTVAGIFKMPPPPHVAGDPSGIGCTGQPGAISDYSGNPPQGTTPVDIVSASASGPQLLMARIDDANNDLIVSAGDRLVLKFNKPIRIISPPGVQITDFILPVTNDTLGAGATFEVNVADSTELLIGLGAGVKLRPDGTFNPAVIAPGSPSGIGIKPGTSSIQDFVGNFVQGGNISDITDTFAPYVVSVRYEDVGNNGLNQGDRLYVKFSEQIITSNLAITDFSLTEPLDSFGNGATLMQSETDEIIITLGTNPRFKVAGVYPINPGSSGLDISTTFVSSHITDISGNPAKRTTAKDIYSTDTTRPTIIAALYGDANNNGIVDGGDTLSVIFSKAIEVNGVVKSDFKIINGNFGIGGIQEGTKVGTNEIVFVLGNAPTLVIEGVFPADPNASAIDLSEAYVSGHITDIAGNNPMSSGWIDIKDANGPVLVSATYFDIDANGVSQGDLLRLRFSRNIVINSPTPAAFVLPVSGDSLGSSPFIGLSASNEITITLGASPILTIAGTYMPGNHTMGSPSGININGVVASITDVSGNPARALPNAIDITGADSVPPVLVSAVYEDLDGNGISINDKITLTYSEMIVVSSKLSLATFTILNGNLGDSPKFAVGTNNREIVITLGANPVLSLFGPNQSAIVRSASTYVPGSIMDISGNDWQVHTPVLIEAKDKTAPQITAAKFIDTDNLGMAAGDRLEIYFNKPILVNGAQPTDFVLPVSGDSLGLGANVVSTSDPKMVAIILGAGVTLTVRGIFSPAKLTPGSPSGINLARVLTSITSIAGVGATPHPVAIDITSDDNVPPRFISAELIGTYGKNIIKARGDRVELKALLDDFSLKASDITADLRVFGLGSAVPAQSYINGEAMWAAFDTPNLRGTIEIVLKAIDIAGNVGTYSLFVSVIMPVEQCVGEIIPSTVLRKSGEREFKLVLKPSFREFDTGMNKIVISVPKGASLNDRTTFTNYDISRSKVYVNGRLTTTRFNGLPRGGESVVTYEAVTGEITILLGERVNQNTAIQTIEVTFHAHVPDFEDEPFGKTFKVTVDDTNDPASVDVVAGNANGILGDSDTLTIMTVGVKISSVTDKVVISSSFWKVIFTIKFNADMNAEKPPRVTFRPTYTNQNEQVLNLMSFVDGIYMGYAVVPFEAFGFNGEYILTIYDAEDYMGNPVNTLTFRQRFSPKFLISAYMNPLDEKTLIIHTKYIPATQSEVLLSNPTIRVWQDMTNETLLNNVVAMNRPNVYKGYYTIDPNYSGRAQIEVEGKIAPKGTIINGKAVSEFTSAFIKKSNVNTMISYDQKLQIKFNKNSFDRDLTLVMTPDYSKVLKYMDLNETSESLPSKVLYAPSNFDNNELKVINEIYQIYPNGLISKQPIEIECDLSSAKTDEIKHCGLFMLNTEKGEWELITKEVKNKKIKAKVNKLTKLAVFSDLTPPKLVIPPELDKKLIKDKLEFELVDYGSGINIATLKALFNDKMMQYKYDEKTKKLTLYIPPKTEGGLHNISIYVEDKLNNVLYMPSLQVNTVGVFDILNHIPYPNPAKNRVNIRYTLGKKVSDLKIKIYNSNAELVYDFGDLLPMYLDAGKHDSPTWMLINNLGEKVANGTYFYKITIYDENNNKVEKFGKISVLK